jgi:hypothetical protein
MSVRLKYQKSICVRGFGSVLGWISTESVSALHGWVAVGIVDSLFRGCRVGSICVAAILFTIGKYEFETYHRDGRHSFGAINWSFWDVASVIRTKRIHNREDDSNNSAMSGVRFFPSPTWP